MDLVTSTRVGLVHVLTINSDPKSVYVAGMTLFYLFVTFFKYILSMHPTHNLSSTPYPMDSRSIPILSVGDSPQLNSWDLYTLFWGRSSTPILSASKTHHK